jgi:hypothetical protein
MNWPLSLGLPFPSSCWANSYSNFPAFQKTPTGYHLAIPRGGQGPLLSSGGHLGHLHYGAQTRWAWRPEGKEWQAEVGPDVDFTPVGLGCWEQSWVVRNTWGSPCPALSSPPSPAPCGGDRPQTFQPQWFPQPSACPQLPRSSWTQQNPLQFELLQRGVASGC